jgi:hypothetical protein
MNFIGVGVDGQQQGGVVKLRGKSGNKIKVYAAHKASKINTKNYFY